MLLIQILVTIRTFANEYTPDKFKQRLGNMLNIMVELINTKYNDMNITNHRYSLQTNNNLFVL